jgi:ribosomal protein S14
MAPGSRTVCTRSTRGGYQLALRMPGRPRGVLTRFQLDRIAFREKALHGELPGIRKASW